MKRGRFDLARDDSGERNGYWLDDSEHEQVFFADDELVELLELFTWANGNTREHSPKRKR